jgi:predicted component of type VI protein secretion system
MAKLILSMDGLVLKELPLTKERTTIGRKPHNDIQIDNLAISGEHAVIVTILNDSFLEDMNSTNGTYVNGQPIKKHFLQNNDVVELGKYRLKYINERRRRPAPDFEKTMVLRPDMMRKPHGGSVGRLRCSSRPRCGPTETQHRLRFGTVDAGRSLSIGNAGLPPPPPPLAAAAPAVASSIRSVPSRSQWCQRRSRTRTDQDTDNARQAGPAGCGHCTRRPQGYFITHVEGAQLPVVNGKPLDAQAHQLVDHDVIEIAGVKMEFFLKT